MNATAAKPKTKKVSKTIRVSPEVAAEMDRYSWGVASDLIDKILRKRWKLDQTEVAK